MCLPLIVILYIVVALYVPLYVQYVIGNGISKSILFHVFIPLSLRLDNKLKENAKCDAFFPLINLWITKRRL